MITIILITLFAIGGMILGAYATRLRKTRNRDRAWNEAGSYYVQVNPFNRPTAHLFTRTELSEPSTRPKRQPEDVPGMPFTVALTVILLWAVVFISSVLLSGCATGPRVIDLTNQPRHAPAQATKAKAETPRQAEANLTHDFTR